MLPLLPAGLLIALALLGSTGVWGETRSVPSIDYPTVQAAVDAAFAANGDGDVIEIAPGLYRENIRIRGVDLTLQSDFATSGDPADVESTVIEGVLELEPVSVVEVRAMDSLPGTDPTNVVLSGLTIRGGDSGVNIRPNAHVELLDSHIVGNSDGVELEGRGETTHALTRATVRRCLIEDNDDDGVDVDQRAELWIEDSIIRDNVQDGIEIRLQDNQFEATERIENVILRNRLEGNGQDGLQLIDYYQDTPRAFRVERNVIAGNGSSGLGMMCEERTIETFEACPIAERVELVHNTFSGNDHGVTGGANLIGVSNVFTSHTNIAVKNVVGPSVLTESILWDNGDDEEGTTLGAAILADPQLDADFLPGAGSPALDQGPAQFLVGPEKIVDLGPCDYRGDAPDLGALERDTGLPLQEVAGMLLASSSEAVLQKGSKLKAASKRLDLGSKKDDVIAGLRFEEIGIPPGAEIAGAHLELVSAKKGTKPAALMIQGEASADAAPLGGAGDLAARTKTAAFASWNVALWPEAGLSDQTPELAPVLQEIVDGAGWDEGNALTVLFTGTGKRSVAVLGSAPLLHVDFHYMAPMCPEDAL